MIINNERELNEHNEQSGVNFIKEQTDDTNELIIMLKNLDQAERREVRGILLGLQMAKGIVKTA